MTPAPAAGYFRISQARDGMHAPDIYERDIRRWAEYRSIAVGEIFSDLDHSGFRRSEDRPALKELVRRRGEFSCVIVPKLSRFGRSLKHLTQLFEMFDRDGIALVFLDLGLETSTSQGRLLRNIMGAFAEYESDVRADYTKANARYAISQGRPFGGKAPYGYTYDKPGRTYQIHPERAEVVRYMYRRYNEGAGQFVISRELAEKGVRTATGCPSWAATKIGRLLDNPAYSARMLLGDELVPGNWEPLVERELWDAVAAKRKVTREQWSRPRRAKRLLAGLMWCGDCGRPAYYSGRGNGSPGRYRCARVDPLDVCSAGGTQAPRAERFVVQAFLERARYILMKGDGGTFVPARQWELADSDERRMLLHAAIERVVIEPLGPGQIAAGSAGRRVRIEWRDEPAEVKAPPQPKGTLSMQRGAQLARAQIADARAKREDEHRVRSERAKAAARAWREVYERSLPQHD